MILGCIYGQPGRSVREVPRCSARSKLGRCQSISSPATTWHGVPDWALRGTIRLGPHANGRGCAVGGIAARRHRRRSADPCAPCTPPSPLTPAFTTPLLVSRLLEQVRPPCCIPTIRFSNACSRRPALNWPAALLTSPARASCQVAVSCAKTIMLFCHEPAQDTVTGFLLAGVGNVDLRRKTNFLVVNESELPQPQHACRGHVRLRTTQCQPGLA